MDICEMMENELIESICITRVFDEDQLYIFIGTVITNTSEENGRIILYKIHSNKKLHKVDSISVPGVVYSIKPYMKSVIASVNGSVSLKLCNIYNSNNNNNMLL